MARVKVTLDHAGIAAELKSKAMQFVVRGVAGRVAQNVNGQGLTAESGASHSGSEIRADVETFVTDRAHALVVVRHPAAEAMQAKHGMLTKAAAQAGLEVRDR